MRPLLAILVLTAAVGASARAQEKTWAGKTVVTKKTGIKIDFLDDGARVPVGTLEEMMYRVLDEKKGQLRVFTVQGAGWFDKADAVPVDEAVAYFSERIRENPNDARAFHVRALVSKMAGKLEFALKDYAESLRLEPQAVVFHNRGIAYFSMKEYDKAIADFSEAIQVDATVLPPYYARGLARTEKKEYDRAVDDFTKLILFDTKNVAAYNGRGDALRGKQEYDKAILDYTEALKLDARQPFVFNNRGLTFFLKKEYDLALKDFDTSEKFDPKNAWVFKNRARLLATSADAKFRDGKRAVAQAKQALALAKQPDADFHETLAAAYAEAGNFDEAIRAQEQALQGRQDDEDARRRLEMYQKKQPVRQK